MEKDIGEIFKQFLSMEKVGLHDNFFDLGISSMDLVQICTQLKELTNIDLPIVTLFTYPTIETLTHHIEN